jgi:hypothetical protein
MLLHLLDLEFVHLTHFFVLLTNDLDCLVLDPVLVLELLLDVCCVLYISIFGLRFDLLLLLLRYDNLLAHLQVLSIY